MSLKTTIVDGKGTKSEAKVSGRGQLITAPIDYSTPQYNLLDTDDAGVTFFAPIADQLFVITDVIADADRNVGATGVTVQIYESNDRDSATVARTILQFDMVKQSSKIITGLNFVSSQTGRFINAKMDDNNVALTIAGYYIDE
jgi:hypothetical protein